MSFRTQSVHRGRPGRVVIALAALAAAVAIAAPARAGNHSVTVHDFFFSPANLTIQAGDSVTWTNQGNFPHNVFSSGNFRCANGCDGEGGNGAPSSSNWSFTRTFSTPGQIDYFCEFHGQALMPGTLTVQGGGGQPGALRFSSATYTVGEGGGSATITVQRVNGDDGPVSVQYATGGGTATPNSDYTPQSGTLNWPDNDDDPRTFTVPILEDSIDEPNEMVGLFLDNPTGGAVLGNPSTATLTITDNDDPGPGPSAGNLRFTVGSQNVQESAGSATAAVQRTGGTAGAVSVQYASADGSATGGDDYTPVAGTLSWAGGDGANKSFQVPIADDGDSEGDETFSLNLSAPSGGATLGTPSMQTVTIVDNDSVEPPPCIEDGNALCLLDDRFRVRVFFTPPGGVEQPANAIPFTNRAGMFWFFNEQNIEMLVKMQNACIPQFDRFWVFYAATTNVAFRVVVTDTEALQARNYSNPQGMVALPRADTDAFATCP